MVALHLSHLQVKDCKFLNCSKPGQCAGVVVMAQKLAPKSRAMVSSLMMGFAYGLGGAFTPLMGKLADIYGLEAILFYSAFIPLLCLGFIVKFPDVDQS